MNRIDATFSRLQASGKSAFVAYICAGDPTLEATLNLARKFDDLGVDILELGVPFSDPMADGSVNQQASERALKNGASVDGVFETIRRIREFSEIPIVLYTYVNPAYAHGFTRFLEDAENAGADGLLLLDLPPGEQSLNEELQNRSNLQLIRLIAPTTPDDRIRELAQLGQGFIYYVSREGVTGERSDLASDLSKRVGQIRESSQVPVVVGFGISTPEQAAAVAEVADGVVVGSAIVRPIAEHGDVPDLASRLADVVKPLVDATKSVRVA